MRLLLGSHGHLASGMATAIEILAGPQPHLTILDAYVDQRNIDEELKAYFRRRNRMYSYKMSRRKDKSICTYPQYECCGYKNCKLYHICSQLKITNRTTDEIEKDKVTL